MTHASALNKGRLNHVKMRPCKGALTLIDSRKNMAGPRRDSYACTGCGRAVVISQGVVTDDVESQIASTYLDPDYEDDVAGDDDPDDTELVYA